LAWQSLEKAIAMPVAEQLAQHPDYQLLIIGHSMGGALATLLGLSYQNYRKSPLVITFGQPRVGNPAFAQFVDEVSHH
jgi:alpha-beta hydrolase superfamily lysophospholipase